MEADVRQVVISQIQKEIRQRFSTLDEGDKRVIRGNAKSHYAKILSRVLGPEILDGIKTDPKKNEEALKEPVINDELD